MPTLATTLSPSGIAVTAVAPGLADTPASRMVAAVGQIEAAVAGQALSRPLTPDDAAHTVAFLASEAAEALTGQRLCSRRRSHYALRGAQCLMPKPGVGYIGGPQERETLMPRLRRLSFEAAYPIL